MLRRTGHYKAFYLGIAALIATDGPGPLQTLARVARSRQRAGKRAGGGFPVPESGRKSLKWAKRVTITDLRNLDLPLWFVWLVRATFILQNWHFLGDLFPFSGKTPLLARQPLRCLRDCLHRLSAKHRP
ncbi:hypothetical protein [Burkholderia gladioli]|uniref:hypothetical protein n=1 Tax=Burkholderia gladioli TaxID=28095 RepID=UPI001640A7AC|nr:hypothetical protein [Burkholderia gladioli]